MSVEQMLQQTNAVDAIARELGVDRSTAQAGAAALLPQILSGMQNPVGPQAAMSGGAMGGGVMGGLGGLLGSLAGMGGGSLLDNVVSPQPTEVSKGNDILGQIFGSKDRSREVAADAAATSGVEPSLLKKMLPILAMVAAGYVMKRAGSGGGLGGGGLGGGGGMFGGQPAGGAAAPTAPGGILGELIGAAGKFMGR